MASFPERLAALEERVRNIADDVDKIYRRVDDIHTLIQQGKGAKWVIVFVAALLSGSAGMLFRQLYAFASSHY